MFSIAIPPEHAKKQWRISILFFTYLQVIFIASIPLHAPAGHPACAD
jgi:hypothetical protein